MKDYVCSFGVRNCPECRYLEEIAERITKRREEQERNRRIGFLKRKLYRELGVSKFNTEKYLKANPDTQPVEVTFENMLTSKTKHEAEPVKFSGDFSFLLNNHLQHSNSAMLRTA